MARTGERYTAARQQVLAKGPNLAAPNAPDAGTAEETAAPVTTTPFRGDRAASDEAIAARTGRTWPDWFAILEAWDAADRPHAEIARWLNAEHGVDGWWAQELTVGYEIATGRRRPGQRPDGFEISVSKTIEVPVERLFEAFVVDAQRARWLPDVSIRLRTATPHRTARFDWEDGRTRLAIGFTAKGDSRSAVALAHQRLPDAEAAERQRSLWRERLAALKSVLEG